MSYRIRQEKLEEVYGKGEVPKAIERYCAASGVPPPPPVNEPWAPTTRSRGLFLDYVTMAQAERGKYESPRSKTLRITRAVVLHIVDRVGGLPALAARMQEAGGEGPASARADLGSFSGHFTAGVGGSCGAFVEAVVRDTVRTGPPRTRHLYNWALRKVTP